MDNSANEDILSLGMDVKDLVAGATKGKAALLEISNGTIELVKSITAVTKSGGVESIVKQFEAIVNGQHKILVSYKQTLNEAGELSEQYKTKATANLKDKVAKEEKATKEAVEKQTKTKLTEDEKLQRTLTEGVKVWNARRANYENKTNQKLMEDISSRLRQHENDKVNQAKLTAEKLKQLAESNLKATKVSQGFETNLGGISNAATTQAIINIRSIESRLENMIIKGKVSEERMVGLFNAIRTRSLASFGTLSQEEKKAEVAIRRLIKSFEDLETAGKRTQDIFISWQGLTRIFAVQVIHNAFSRLINGLVGSVSAAQEYVKGIAEIQTITQEANKSTNDWNISLRNLSNNYNTDLLKAVNASYEAISNQIASGTTATTFLGNAFDFARATASTADQSVNLLSATLNAYGEGAQRAGKHSAVLFNLIDLGRVRAGEIANTFGNTTSLAAQMGISIEEVSAALATLTIQGIRNDTSMTLLNNVILKLLKPTKDMDILFKKWGVTSGETAIATFGFSGVLSKLNQEFNSGGLDKITDLAKDMRAIRGEVALTGKSFDSYTSAFDQITNGQEKYNRAVAITADTLNYKFSKEINKVINLFTSDASQRIVKINYDMIESFGDLSKEVSAIANGFLNFYEILSKVAQPFIYLEVATSGLLTKTIPAFTTFLSTSYLMGHTTSLVTSRFKFLQDQMAALSVAGQANTSFFSKLNVLLFQAKLNADGTTASVYGLNTALGILTIGIPLALSAIAYVYSAHLDEQRRLTNLAAETTAKLEEENRKVIDNLNARIVAETDLLQKSLSNNSKYLYEQISIIRRGLTLFKNDLSKIDFKFDNIHYENTLIDKDIYERIPLIKNRINELIKTAQGLKFEENASTIKDIFEEVADSIKDNNRDIIKEFNSLTKETEKLKDKLLNLNLDKKLFGKSDSSKYKIIKDELNQSLVEGNLDKAKDLAEKLVNIAESTKSRSKYLEAVTKQEEVINKLMQEQEDKKKFLEGSYADNTQIKDNMKWYHEQETAFKTLNEEAAKFEATMRQINDLIKANETKISNLQTSLRGSVAKTVGSGTVLKDTFSNLAFWENITIPQRFDVENKLANFNTQLKELEKLSKDVNASPTAFIEKKTELLKQVADLEEKFTSLSSKDFLKNKANEKDTYEDLFKNFRQDVLNMALLSKDTEAAFAERKALANQSAEIAKIQLEAANKLAVFGNGFRDLLPALDTAAVSTANMIQAAERIVEAARIIMSNQNGSGKALGGMLGYAPGGLLRGSVGRDNKMFMGHDGEYVFNAESTRRFYPQINAMNNTGTMANNTHTSSVMNIGDINIHANVSGNNTQQSVTEIGRQLRRAIRNGQVKL